MVIDASLAEKGVWMVVRHVRRRVLRQFLLRWCLLLPGIGTILWLRRVVAVESIAARLAAAVDLTVATAAAAVAAATTAAAAAAVEAEADAEAEAGAGAAAEEDISELTKPAITASTTTLVTASTTTAVVAE